MGRIVAIDLPGGPAFVDAVLRVWGDGDAILPLDRSLPASAKERLLAAAAVHRVIDETGTGPGSAEATVLPDGAALVVATSGTTGEPKLIVHGLDGLTAHAAAVHRHLEVGPEDRWLACLPLAHIGGLGVVLRAILDDVGLDVIDGFDAAVVEAAPRTSGSTLVSLVPTALDRIDGGGFRKILVGGSADLGDRSDAVVRTYGTTETGGGIVYDRTPLDGVEIEIDPAGEILVRSPSLAVGRLVGGELRPIVEADGAYRTGDRGRWEVGADGSRHLVVEGRADDLIITGGVNVWPSAVEAVIAAQPGVDEAAVFGVPDPEWGSRVVAAVVPGPGAVPTLDALRAAVRDVMAPAAAPKELRIVASLPRTGSGKVRRAGLPEATHPGEPPRS